MGTPTNTIDPLNLSSFTLTNPKTKKSDSFYLVYNGNHINFLINYYNISQESYIAINSAGDHCIVDGNNMMMILEDHHIMKLEHNITKCYIPSDFYMSTQIIDRVNWGDFNIKPIIMIEHQEELDKKTKLLDRIGSMINKSNPSFSYENIFVLGKPKDYMAAKKWITRINPNYYCCAYIIDDKHEVLLEVTRSFAPSQLNDKSQLNDMVIKITNLNNGDVIHDGVVNNLYYGLDNIKNSVIKLLNNLI